MRETNSFNRAIKQFHTDSFDINSSKRLAD